MPKVLEEIDTGEVDPAELIDASRSRGLVVWDLETTGLDPRRHRIEGVAFYVPPDSSGQELRAWYPFTKGTMRTHVQPDESPEEQAARLKYERTADKYDLNAWNNLKQEPTVIDLRDPMPQAETMEALRPLFEQSPDVVAVAHNVKFDVSFMKYASGMERGVWMPVAAERTCRLADSMLADFLCDENGYAYGLKKRVRDLFDHDMVTYKDILKNRRQQVFGFLADTLKADALGTYAMDDCYWTWRLFEDRMKKLDELTPGQMLADLDPSTVDPKTISPFFKDRTMGTFERIYWGIDMKIAMVLEEMESRGILIDWRWLKKVTVKLNKKKEDLLDIIEKKIGWTLNPNSAPQVSTLLFAPPPTGLGLPTEGIKQGKSGQFSTGSNEIAHLSRVNPIVKEILDWRSADTIINNFSQKLTRLSIDEPDNRIYSHFNQTGTKIYRLSCVSGGTVLGLNVDGTSVSSRIDRLREFSGRDVLIVTHKGRERRITHLINKGPGFMFDVETEDGKTIRCTAEHRFYTERGWRALKDIELGDRLLRAEVCEAQASSRGTPMGVGSTVVPTDLRRGHASRALEDSRLRTVERDCAAVQGSLRVGVYPLVQENADEVTGPDRDSSRVPDLHSIPADEGIPAHQGVVQDRVRGQRLDAGGGQEEVRHLAPSHDSSGNVLPRVRVGIAGEAWEVDQRQQAQALHLLSEDGSVRVATCRKEHDRDRRAIRRRRVSSVTGHPAARYRPVKRSQHLVACASIRRGTEGPSSSQSRRREDDSGEIARLRGSRGNLPAIDVVGAEAQRRGERLTHEGITRHPRPSAPHLRSEPQRDAVVASPDRSWDSTPTPSLLLQELASGLCVAGEEADGRGRWRFSPELRGDAGARLQEDKEGEGAWLYGAALHDGQGRQEAANCDPQDRAGAWARVTSITPVGIETVWDITVEGDASYVAQGFVNHNSSNPVNLQNQPRDQDLIRKAFCAYLEGSPPDLLLFGCDYSQVELRVAAHLSLDKGMIEVYKGGTPCKKGIILGTACERYKLWECGGKKDGIKCGHTWTPSQFDPALIGSPRFCPKCGDTDHIEHQARCRHVDLHTRTAEDANVPRNPLAKCLDGSTLVLGMQAETGRSWIQPATIETLIGDIEPGEHRPVPVTGLRDGRGIAVSARSALKRHKRPTKIVITKRAIVVATEDHRFQVIGDYDSLDPFTPGYVHVPGMSLVEAQSLEKGMALPVADPAHPHAREANHLGDDFHGTSQHGELRLNPFTKEVDPDGPASIKLDEKWAYFAGMFAGDGCASGNACVITHGSAPEYEEWRRVVRGACDAVKLPTSVSGDKRQTRLGSRVVRRYLCGLELCREKQHRSGEKIMRVPSWVLSGGPKMIWSYIAGLFDTDGTVGNEKSGTVSFTTKYPEFAGQVAFLLRWLGMPILVQPGFNKTYERWYYTVHVLAEGFPRFLKYCPMRYREKVEKLRLRDANVKRRIAPSADEVVLVLDGGERTVYDFQVESDDHLYLQGGLIGHNNLNFGNLYRIGAPRFCQYADLYDDNGKPRLDYAQQVIDAWYEAYPGIKPFQDKTEWALKNINNWIAYTITGRARRLGRERYKNEYRAVTQGIQFQVSGSAQDILKIAMLRIFEARNKLVANTLGATRRMWLRFRQIIQVHDEVMAEAPTAIKDEVIELMTDCMENAAVLRVPLKTDVRCGRTWDHIH